MQFSSFNEFISMGGYGFYVWLSFGSATLILSILLFSSKAGHKQIINQISKRIQREDKLRAARQQQKQLKQQSDDLTKVTE